MLCLNMSVKWGSSLFSLARKDVKSCFDPLFIVYVSERLDVEGRCVRG